MMLVTEAMRRTIPDLYKTEGLGDCAIVQAKFFDILTTWTWYVIEMGAPAEDDSQTYFFGMIHGHEDELSYFTLKDLQSLGRRIERDLDFSPITLGELRQALDEGRTP